MLKTTPNFALLTPLLKIRGMGEVSIPTVEAFAYDRTSEIHFIAIHCAAAERGVLVKLENVGIANALWPSEPRQLLPALITTP